MLAPRKVLCRRISLDAKFIRNEHVGVEPTLAARLRHFLSLSKLSRAELARRVGVSPAAVTSWLSDDGSSPEYVNLTKAVAVMGVTMHTFYGPLVEAEAIDDEAAAS